jgi:hypothetical protein
MNSTILDFMEENNVIIDVYKVPEGLEEANENIEKMVEWLESGGGSMDGLEVRFFSNVYRGVFLKKDAKVRFPIYRYLRMLKC